MATIIVNADDKSEKVLKAFLNALEIDFEVQNKEVENQKLRPMNKKEKQLFESLKRTFIDIKKWEKGEIDFKDAKAFLDEL